MLFHFVVYIIITYRAKLNDICVLYKWILELIGGLLLEISLTENIRKYNHGELDIVITIKTVVHFSPNIVRHEH